MSSVQTTSVDTSAADSFESSTSPCSQVAALADDRLLDRPRLMDVEDITEVDKPDDKVNNNEGGDSDIKLVQDFP